MQVQGKVRSLTGTMWVVGGLHLVALVLMVGGHLSAGLSLGLVLFAYTRGLLHALDADHLCMIDGSTRKLLGEGRDPRGIGLAFSLGHSTVVLVAGLLVVAGSRWVNTAISPDSRTAMMLGLFGACVSSLYLLGVAAANVPQLARALKGDTTEGHQHGGWWARLLAAPLSRVRHAGHVYLFGVLFGLGFDTASTIALLMLTAAATLSGVSVLTVLALPVAFTAAMTLGDSINANLMLGVYRAANTNRRRTLNVALLGLSIVSAVAVALVTLTELAGELGGPQWAVPDTTMWGWGLAAVAAAGGVWLGWLHTHRRHPAHPQPTR